MSEALLSVQQLEVVYRRAITAVQGVSFIVPQGHIVGILGTNGAGKTTLLRAISGFHGIDDARVTDGSIAFKGTRIDNGEPHRIYTRAGGPYLSDVAGASTRLPSGHPEAFLEAFANIYTAAYDDIVKRASGQKFDGATNLYPNVADGVDGMNFITQSVASSKENGAWLSLKHPLCRS